MQVHRYVPSTEMDSILLVWRAVMVAEGEFAHTFSQTVEAPSAFLHFFDHRPLVFTIDEFGNIVHAAWIELCMGSVFLSYYVAKGARYQQKKKYQFLYDIIDQAFREGANSVVGVIQERDTPEATQSFIEIHRRLGYVYGGRLPKFFDGKTAHLVTITNTRWATLEDDEDGGKFKRSWLRERAKRRKHSSESVPAGDSSGPATSPRKHVRRVRASRNGVSLPARLTVGNGDDSQSGQPIADETATANES